MSNVLSHKENANQNYTEISSQSECELSRKHTTTNVGKDVGRNELIHSVGKNAN
jgi:hypothetical protein